ncbi:SGNH/GDSL hydrolase family protein [Undibacterium sp. Ren11W]|uniref:SGNH/GDSL hydrolase family protein n=1 Tax=Undibacterium sp. Ren11W TaxID=3413045 RepID=UPI003BF10FBC
MIAIALMVIIEFALQIRAHFRSGESVFNLIFAESVYVKNDETGLLLLRPNKTIIGSQTTLRSNSLGLRSPEIPIAREEHSWRVAVVGASTVMGAYAADNDKTFPAQLEQRLRKQFPLRKIDVVNAGIAGMGLDEQRRMLETRVATLKPDLVVVYPGFNDFAVYCQDRGTGTKQFQRQGLPIISLPDWLQTVDMIKKNTVFLRTANIKQASLRNPANISLQAYQNKLEAFIQRAAELKIKLVLATNARAYRPEQSLSDQAKLSETARYYNHCFDIAGLHQLYDRHNTAIRQAVYAHQIQLIDLDTLVPGGSRYFADSSHFSFEGEVLVADTLYDFIIKNKLLVE